MFGHCNYLLIYSKIWASLGVQSDAPPTGDQKVMGLIPDGAETFFHGDWSRSIFCGTSLPSADSRRAVVSSWQKNVQKCWLTA